MYENQRPTLQSEIRILVLILVHIRANIDVPNDYYIK